MALHLHVIGIRYTAIGPKGITCK